MTKLIHDHNTEIADACSQILRKIRRENKDLSLAVMAALGCGLLYNAVRNHPDYQGDNDEQVTKEMHRLVEDFLDTFTPTAIN